MGKPTGKQASPIKNPMLKKLLKRREGQIEEGRFYGLKVEKTLFDELCKYLVTDYKVNSRKSLDRVELSIMHLAKHFKDYRANSITTATIKEYIAERKEEGAENGNN